MQRAPLRPPGTGVGSLRGRVDRRLPRRGQKPPTRGILAPLETLCSLHSRSGGISRETETDKEMQTCVLCGRDIPQHLLSRHHLVPKLRGGRSTEENLVLMHRPCHDKVHAVFTETQLARDYHSVDSLLADPDISKFVRWIQKRPIDFSDSTMSVRRRQQRMQRRK